MSHHNNINSCPQQFNSSFNLLDDPFSSTGDVSAMFKRLSNVSQITDKQAILTSLELDYERLMEIAMTAKTIEEGQQAYDQAARCYKLQKQTEKDLEFLQKKHIGASKGEKVQITPIKGQKH